MPIDYHDNGWLTRVIEQELQSNSGVIYTLVIGYTHKSQYYIDNIDKNPYVRLWEETNFIFGSWFTIETIKEDIDSAKLVPSEIFEQIKNHVERVRKLKIFT